MDFKETKRRILEGKDFSIKGSIDEFALDLVNYINSKEEFVTTSSCSGRIVVVARKNEPNMSGKTCEWLFLSHDIFPVEDLVAAVVPTAGDLILKFEPFILHVLCADSDAANTLVKVAYNAGFRESGMLASGNNRMMVAVRTNTQLAVPLCKDSKLLVSEEYLKFLTESALEKMKANCDKIHHLFSCLKEKLDQPQQCKNKYHNKHK